MLEEVGFPNSIVNAPVAIKYIYLRYLDRYEKLHFHGEENERADDEDDENRHKRWNARLLHNVPNTYNYHQHAVSGKSAFSSFPYNSQIPFPVNPIEKEYPYSGKIFTLQPFRQLPESCIDGREKFKGSTIVCD